MAARPRGACQTRLGRAYGRLPALFLTNAPVVRISGLRRGSAPIGERGEDREGRSRPANATGASVCQSRRPGCGCCRGSCAKRDWGERLSIPSGQDAGCAEGACQTRLGRAHGRLPAISLTNASLGSVSGLRRPGAAIGERGQDRGGRSRPANASGESVCPSEQPIDCDRSPLWSDRESLRHRVPAGKLLGVVDHVELAR